MTFVGKIKYGLHQLKWLAIRSVRSALGLDTSLTTEDRRLLEQTILPYFAEREEFDRVLFVGCDWYTSHYSRMFAEREYWTLEIDPDRSKYGAKGRHVTDSLGGLASHFPPDYFDLIVCNGVFGWGLDARSDAEASFDLCFDHMRANGVFVLGWNDLPASRAYPPEESDSLARFDAYTFQPLATAQYHVPGDERHIFNFYRKS